MLLNLIIVTALINLVSSEKPRILSSRPSTKRHFVSAARATTQASKTTPSLDLESTSFPFPFKSPVIKESLIPKKKKHSPKIIQYSQTETWAKDIADTLTQIEDKVVRRDVLLKGFTDVKMEVRSGAAIVDTMTSALEAVLETRLRQAENIMRQAESLAKAKTKPPNDYVFDRSLNLDKLKKEDRADPSERGTEYVLPVNCSSLRKITVENGTHFELSTKVNMDITSVQIVVEVYDCDPEVLQDLYWSEKLLSTFQKNYALDAMTDFQYFCSGKGFLRHYPAASWASMFNLHVGSEEDEGPADVYDCRLRPWYVAAGGAPRDILVLLDASGSMHQSTNKVNAEQFTLALLSALTDDDQVNVLRFNYFVKSPISCFNDILVPANHVNSQAMMAALATHKVTNYSRIPYVLRESVRILQNQEQRTERPPSCQQAIILLTDAIEENFTQIMRDLDPSGRIRLFVIWLHDPNGLRDNSREYGQWLGCTSDGFLSELVTSTDVTEQVMKILKVLERPLVAQRAKRLRVLTDVYAHMEDPRRGEYHWTQKESIEQDYRFKLLRQNKEWLLSMSQLTKDHLRQLNLDKLGHYYEGEDLDYRLQISVSVPVFDHTTSENITILLPQALERYSTRTYPVNRLLGVAGIDVPIEHLKLLLPYHELGAGGTLFIVDHRGNIVLHDNIKPVFDGDILKPNYRTVDFLDLEQSGFDHKPRNYTTAWIEFRQDLVINQKQGTRTMYAKNIYEDGMRAILELRAYYWKRVLDHYTAVVVLPMYNRKHAVPDGTFSQKLATAAFETLDRTDFSVHPDWLYCRHVDPKFTEREIEVKHFIKRRIEEPNFAMKNLKHIFSPIKPTLFEKTYQCNEKLMGRLCKEAIVTAQWADEHEEKDTERDCSTCELGSTTAFFATESGLTRWQQYHATSAHADPPAGSEWARGPSEPWYLRASVSPGTLVIHAPVSPVRKMRNSDARPPPLSTKYRWYTAARTLGLPEKGIVGVAGYHFYPQHLEDVLKSVTNSACTEEEDECDARCDGEDWSCVLIDEGGWIVAGAWKDPEDVSEEDPAREHLSRVHPQAMSALLSAQIFKLKWIHDYQAVCFTFVDEPVTKGVGQLIPTIFVALWRSLVFLSYVTKELVTFISFFPQATLVAADTEKEKKKRRDRLAKDYEREKYERLYDQRVLVNRTRFAACDRSRVLYQFQRNAKTFALLKRAPDPNNPCNWPLVGAELPNTNLVLLAIYNLCPHVGRPVPDPLVNMPVHMDVEEWANDTAAGKLACWRNKVPFPARAPPMQCYPHDYKQEEGYRQCGPWQPDPMPEEEPNKNGSLSCHNNLTLTYIIALFLNYIYIIKLTLP